MTMTGQKVSAQDAVNRALIQILSQKGPERREFWPSKILKKMAKIVRGFFQRLVCFLF
jgi:hypothetical protein